MVAKPLQEGIKGILSGVWDLMGSIVSFALEAIGINIDEVLASIKKVWDDVWGGISSFVGGIWNSISTVVSTSINNVKTAISGVLDSIKKTWEKMWNGLKDFVKNTWNTIISFFSKGGKIFDGVVGAIGDIFKSICNAIIGGINKVIAAPLKVISDALKTIHNIDLPLIGKPFTIVPNGFNIPQIPKLAQGGYVKPNQPQLAMIGDNRHQGEVVAPEDKMIDMIDTALKMQKSKGNTEGMDTLIMLIRELIELVKNMVLKVDIDIKKLSVLLENAKKERQMIGG